MSVELPATVQAAIDGGPTPPLEDYVAAMRLDDNVCWALPQGDLVNLLDEALERLGLA